jgi:hypothetical protein
MKKSFILFILLNANVAMACDNSLHDESAENPYLPTDHVQQAEHDQAYYYNMRPDPMVQQEQNNLAIDRELARQGFYDGHR